MVRPSFPPSWAALALLPLAVSVAGAAPRHARAAHRPASTPTAVSAGIGAFATPGIAGMVVGVDPETGRLGPATAAQRLELSRLSAEEQRMLSRSSAGLVVVRHPNGMSSMDLQGRFQDFEMVTIGPDGKPRFNCVSDVATANLVLATPAAPAKEDR
jgi:hypothetical protein